MKAFAIVLGGVFSGQKNDIERSQQPERQKCCPIEPDWILWLLADDAGSGDIGSDNRSWNIFDYLFKIGSLSWIALTFPGMAYGE